MWYSYYIDNNSIQENPVVVQDKPITQVLPAELFEYILSFLDPKDMQSTAIVDHFWSLRTVTVARQEFVWIQDVNAFLIKKLTSDDALANMYSDQIERLSYLADNKYSQLTKNLIEVRLLVLFLRERNVDALRGISLEHLSGLVRAFTNQVPSFFKTTFILARIYEKINQMNIYGDQRSDLYNEFREIIKKDILSIDDIDCDEIVQVADAINDDQLQNMILMDIAEILQDKGYAVSVTAELPPTVDDRDLFDTSKLLTSAGFTDVADNLIEGIEDNVLKGRSLCDLLTKQTKDYLNSIPN